MKFPPFRAVLALAMSPLGLLSACKSDPPQSAQAVAVPASDKEKHTKGHKKKEKKEKKGKDDGNKAGAKKTPKNPDAPASRP